MDWDSYYEKFYDWATSTQIKKMSSLTSFGASAEVAEVAQEYMDEKAAALFIYLGRYTSSRLGRNRLRSGIGVWLGFHAS